MCIVSVYLESVFVPQVPVQSVLLLLRNVSRKDVHHLTALLVASSAAAVSSSLLGCCIFCTKKTKQQQKQINQSPDWPKFCSLPSSNDVMLTQELSRKEAKDFPNITHLMTGPRGESEFCFPETLNVPRGETKLIVSRVASQKGRP